MVILPFALLPLLFFNFNARIMGNAFVLGTKMKIFFSVVAVAVIAMNVYLVCLFIVYWDVAEDDTLFVVKWIALGLFVTIYCGCIGYLIHDFVKENTWTVPGDPELEDKLSKYARQRMHVNVGGMVKIKETAGGTAGKPGIDDEDRMAVLSQKDEEMMALLGGDLSGTYHE